MLCSDTMNTASRMESTGRLVDNLQCAGTRHVHLSASCSFSLLHFCSHLLLVCNPRVRTAHATNLVVCYCRGQHLNVTADVEHAVHVRSSGVPGRIHVSDATFNLLPQESWEPTGGVDVKGKVRPNLLSCQSVLSCASLLSSHCQTACC